MFARIACFSSSLQKDSNGVVIGYQNIIRDITEKQEVEKALEESEQRYKELYAESKKAEHRYRSLLDCSPDAIVIYDSEGKPTYLNNSFTQMFGWTLPEVQEKQIPFVPDSERESTTNAVKRVISQGSTESGFETKRLTKDGRTLDITLSASGYFDNAGAYEGMLVILRDVTPRLRAEKERENEREKFQTLVDNAPFGMVMIRNDTTYEYVNPKFTEMFGYELEDIPDGRQWFRKAYPDPEYRRKVVSAWVRDQKEHRKGEHTPRTFTVTCADGTEKMIHFSSVPPEHG